MEDCGLKSYQDIVEPEFPEPELDRIEREKVCDENAVEIFRSVLEIQRETGDALWFDWTPECKITVYVPGKGGGWHAGGGIHIVVDAEIDGKTMTEIDRQFDEIWDALDRWRDKRLFEKDVERFDERQKQIEKELKGLG